MMVGHLEALRAQIEALCRRHHVRRLELFGSAATGELGPDSDVDFLVDFAPLGIGQYTEHYFSLQADLASLLGRPVDLVVLRAVRNPYFLEGIARSRELLYAT